MKNLVRTWLATGLLVGLCPSCSGTITRATSERASWAYVEDAWGGLALQPVISEGNRISFPIKLGVHDFKVMDSGICVTGVRARLEAGRILIGLDRGLCGPAVLREVIAKLEMPRAGSYVVVYDDAAANFPVIARVEVR